MISRFFSLRQLCLGSTSLAVAVIGTSAAAMADQLPIIGEIASAMDKPAVQQFMNADSPMTMYGITLYGTVDVGVNNMTHGTPSSPEFATNVGGMLQKQDYNNSTYMSHSGLEQSKLGLKGSEELIDGVSVVFKLETGFSPLSGQLINGQKTLMVNANGSGSHGSWLPGTSLMGDTSRDGQLFQGGAFGGLSNPTFGTLTFGRHATPMLDLINAYDPQEGSNAFSPIGLSGAAAGMGDTEDARLDRSIKYNVKYGPARLAAIYQFMGTANNSGGDDASEFNLGADYGPLSIDALYGVKHDAINVGNPASLSGSGAYTLAPTISDNHAYTVMAKYDLDPVKLYAGYEHIKFSNPNNPLNAADASGQALSGFSYSNYSNTSYNINKTLHIMWMGEQFKITKDLKFDLGYYMYIQENYSGYAQATCLSNNKSSCYGTEEFVSGVFDYRLNKRFDIYAGTMYTRVNDGMYVGNSFLHNNTLSTEGGVRFKF